MVYAEYKTLEEASRELGTTELEEAPLVMAERDIMDTVLSAIKKEFDKQANKSPEKALAMLQQLGKIVGYGITKSNQSKGKAFRYDLKK